MENGKVTYPLRNFVPRPPVSGGQSSKEREIRTESGEPTYPIHFLPLRQGESRRGGGMKTENGKRKSEKRKTENENDMLTQSVPA